MTKNDFLNKIPWLWIALGILSVLVILQYVQILELRKTLWHTFDGIAAAERARAVVDARTQVLP